MSTPAMDAAAMRWAVAAFDHHAALSGYAAVPESPPAGGGWRRLYLREAEPSTLSAVGPESGPWASLGVEIPCPRGVLEVRAGELLRAMAPYEVAIDPDAGASHRGPEAVLRLALRLFVEGLHGHVFRDAVGNLAEAAKDAREALGI